MSDLLILVPARGGSKRLPGKNHRLLLGGLSLMQWTDRAIREAFPDAAVWLSTDDEDIASHGKQIGWTVPGLRPATLARDESTSESVVAHSLDLYRAEHDADPEMLLLLQVTSPFRKVEELTEAVSALRETPSLNSVLGVRPIHRRGDQVFVRDTENRLSPVGSAEQAGLQVANGALYLVRSKAFRETGSLTPAPVYGLSMNEAASIDIDTQSDFSKAEYQVEQFPRECGH